MKCLITGGGGQLAYACKKAIPGSAVFPLKELDITDKNAIEAQITEGVTHIINTAAITRVDDAEEDHVETMRVNGLGPLYLAERAAELGAVLIHISTDNVFDGVMGGYKETDPVSPKNVYGLSKVLSEVAVRSYTPRHYIIRTSALFGPNENSFGNNFVSRLLERGKAHDPIKMVEDQYTCPTYTMDLASAILALITANAPFGTYHIVNSGGNVSWHDFAYEVLSQGKLPHTLEAVPTLDQKGKAYRPRKSTLQTLKLEEAGIVMRDWREALREYLRLITSP